MANPKFQPRGSDFKFSVILMTRDDICNYLNDCDCGEKISPEWQVLKQFLPLVWHSLSPFEYETSEMISLIVTIYKRESWDQVSFIEVLNFQLSFCISR